MNSTTIASKKDTSTLVRAVFGPGMLLQHEDLEQLNAYTRDLSCLLFRSFFGCGVVCGLIVSVGPDKCGNTVVTVKSGLALDCEGNPIYVPRDETFALDENCSLDLTPPLSFWVLLCRTQKCCAPRTAICSCDDDGATSECTRERECFEIRVVTESALPDCVCYCADKDRKPPMEGDVCGCVNPEDSCYKDHYAGVCGCTCEGGSSCDCDCVVLAKLNYKEGEQGNPSWSAEHKYRRFIRPPLILDPQPAIDTKIVAAAKKAAPKVSPPAKRII